MLTLILALLLPSSSVCIFLQKGHWGFLESGGTFTPHNFADCQPTILTVLSSLLVKLWQTGSYHHVALFYNYFIHLFSLYWCQRHTFSLEKTVKISEGPLIALKTSSLIVSYRNCMICIFSHGLKLRFFKYSVLLIKKSLQNVQRSSSCSLPL